MAKFPVDASRGRVLRALQSLGFAVVREREHIAMERPNADGTKTPLTMPNHATIKASTLRTICTQSGISRGDFIEDEKADNPVESATQEMLKDKIEQVLKTLTYREREIIKRRYGIGDGYTYSLEEVGRIFKVTRERVRQVEAKAIRKLGGSRPVNRLRGRRAVGPSWVP